VLYAAESTGTPATLPALPMQYADYAVWQRDWLQGDVLAKQLTYWRQQLDGAPPVLELPTDYPRPVVPSHRGAKHRFTFSADLTQHVHTLSHQYGVSLFMTLLAAFQVFVAHYAGQTDIVVGAPIANRTHQESEGLIGFLVNTLLFRTRLDGNPTFAEVLVRVKDMCLDAYDHQDLPFEKLVEELQPERDPSRNPLFQVMLQLQKNDVQVLTLPGLEIERLPNPGGLAKFDLNLFFLEDGKDLQGIVDYSTDLFAASTITRMLDHFQTLVQALVANPEQLVYSIEFLTEAERQQQLVDWNATTTTYPAESCVHHLFEAQVAERPNAIAVVYENEQLTYQAFNLKANRLAQQLQQQGVLRGDIVPVVMERSVELIISYFAIMKVGAAFSPLDPNWPSDRLRTLLTQLSSHVVLTNQDPGALKTLCPEKRVMSVDASTLAAHPENLHVSVQPEDPIYVLFTSGSTGIPKGAINHHRGIVNRLWNMQQRYSWSEDDVVLVTLRHTFDASLWQYLWPLTHGARLVLPSPSPWLDMFLIVQLMEQERVTLSGFVPSLFALFVDEVEQQPLLRDRLRSLRQLLIGGEALHAPSVNQFRRGCPGVQISNSYGPTEASISTIYHEVPDPCKDPIPIGRPLKNVKAVILDDQLNLVPVGVPGELHLGGVCVGLGYLNNSKATQAAFIPNPFPELNTSILYKTGDRACFQPDGTIRYLGRRDHQVKINGVRMELGEIEVVLRRHPEVKQAVVQPWATPSGGNRLVAYVVGTQTNASLEYSEITNFLSQYLPTYMIPSTFRILEQLPLLPNGKINRHALPPPQSSRSQSEEFIPPQTPHEERLARIFAEVLKVEVVGRHDNFFALGGHSLLAMMMVSRIHKIFGITLEVRALFDQPTIANLASYLEAQTVKPTEPDVAPRPREDGALPLSFAQQRLWFLDQWEPDSPLYNIPKVFRLSGPLNIQALHQALALLVTRHETLRTTFTSVDGTPYHVISEDTGPNVIFHDLKEWSLTSPQDRALELAIQEAEQPFQLHRGPLFRVMLLELSDQEHWLCLTLHH
ncbi:MAG: amino acid adenylation domain-containing protein, partial [Nitrospirales bacterium]